MFTTLKNAFKIKEIRMKLLFTFLMLIVIRFGSQLPVPGVDRNYFSSWFEAQTGGAFNFFDAFTGGSFLNMSVFALNITPYITSSIIIQLLTIAIPKVIAALTAGSAFLMWIGERITEKGVGNGISIVLIINIISRMPDDFSNLYEQFVKGKSVPLAVVSAIVIIAIILAMIVLVIILNDGVRKIPVQYAKKIQGNKMVGGQSTFLPLKVNTAGVIPIIFASSLMQFPIVISSLVRYQGTGVWRQILNGLNQDNWCKPDQLVYSIGLVVYIVLTVFFAYFYTSLTFNPLEISNNMKKQGGFIPGIRPGKPTTDYLTKVLNAIIFIGAIGLVIVAVIPFFFNGVFGANVSFGGTSLIIIVSVILETIRQIESQMLVRNYKGFLND